MLILDLRTGASNISIDILLNASSLLSKIRSNSIIISSILGLNNSSKCSIIDRLLSTYNSSTILILSRLIILDTIKNLVL